MLLRILKQMERDGLVSRTVLPSDAGFGRIRDHAARGRVSRQAILRRERPTLELPATKDLPARQRPSIFSN